MSQRQLRFTGGSHSTLLDQGFLSRLLPSASASTIGTRRFRAANQLRAAARLADGKLDNSRLNAYLAVIDGVQPANEVEAMLASQMAVSHRLIMELLIRAVRTEQIPHFESAGNLAANLLKALAGHAELLNKLKRGGEQTVRVQRVRVHPEGQAIVGNVTTGGSGTWVRLRRKRQRQ